MPGGETGWGSGHLVTSSPEGVAPNPQNYNPSPTLADFLGGAANYNEA
jgi:hypothetical protein